MPRNIKNWQMPRNIKYYQNLNMPGDTDQEKARRKDSHYWNEGKWNNFIAPFLPENCEDMTFVEVGCNSGLFLKLAKERGFRDVVGVEKDKGTYERAIEYKKYNGYDYRLLHREVGHDFSFDELPAADFTLLANVHYYFRLGDWIRYLDRLRYKTCYCIIVSSHAFSERERWWPKRSINGIRWTFRDWEEVRAKYRAHHGWREKGDQARRELHSHLFRSTLRRKKFSELNLGAIGTPAKYIRDHGDPFREMTEKGLTDLTKTAYYKVWEERMGDKWSKKRIHEFVKEKAKTMIDVRKNGMRNPIIVRPDDTVIDGAHRTALLKELGYKSIITRTL